MIFDFDDLERRRWSFHHNGAGLYAKPRWHQDNLGMYRLQVYDKNRLGMHWQIHKDSAHFFHEYKKAGKKMPVSIGIGGDPLYIWCGQAPMPNWYV